jgi:hypothetical protein
VGDLHSTARSEGYSPRVQANSKFAQPGAREHLQAHACHVDGGTSYRRRRPNAVSSAPVAAPEGRTWDGRVARAWRTPVQHVADVAAVIVIRTAIGRMIGVGTATLHSFAPLVVRARSAFECMVKIPFLGLCM